MSENPPSVLARPSPKSYGSFFGPAQYEMIAICGEFRLPECYDSGFSEMLASAIAILADRARFGLVKALMRRRRFESLLVAGFEDGSFLSGLAPATKSLAGIAPHPRHLSVQDSLAHRSVRADLRQATLAAIPFEDSTFDCAVAVRALDIGSGCDVEAASRELFRVLKPRGQLYFVLGKGADSTFYTLTRHFLPGDELATPVTGAYRAFRMDRPDEPMPALRHPGLTSLRRVLAHASYLATP